MSTAVEEIEKEKTSEAEKGELLLDSLVIKGYRCFEHLTIEKLGRVNLIVGKNSVGKSSLLEAIWIYTQRGTSDILIKILSSRDDSPPQKERTPFSLNQDDDLKKGIWNIRHLFYEREDIREDSKLLNIFPQTQPERKLQIFVFWYDTVNKKRIESPKEIVNAEARIQSSFNGKIVSAKRLEDIYNSRIETITETDKCLYVKSDGLESKDVSELWDRITLTDAEDAVLEALQLLSKRIKRVNVVGGSEIGKSRLPKVVVVGEKEPIALRSMGDGMSRLFGISLALVNCNNGILLIDEIENGLHYSVLPDVWKLVFRTAKELNVQVFATTHSKDCIEAFTQAAIDDEESDGMLIRLENKDGKIRAVNFNEDELETVERRNIEVR